MQSQNHPCAWLALLLAFTAGCASSDSAEDQAALDAWRNKQQSNAPATPAQPQPADTASREPVEQEEPPTRDREPTESTVPADAKAASERPPLQSNPGTYIGAIAQANRNIRQRLDDVSWQKSVQLFEADKGYRPRNTKEFLDLVRGEGTPLPDIPEGFAYWYVPGEGQFGELYQLPADQLPASEMSPPRGGR